MNPELSAAMPNTEMVLTGANSGVIRILKAKVESSAIYCYESYLSDHFLLSFVCAAATSTSFSSWTSQRTHAPRTGMDYSSRLVQ